MMGNHNGERLLGKRGRGMGIVPQFLFFALGDASTMSDARRHLHMLTVQSLFSDLPSNPFRSEELFLTLLEKPGMKVERIVSHGQSSPEGFWYDQAGDEWVMLARGTARLEVEGQLALELIAGDHVTIPARLRHRVAWTSDDAVWLAVHFGSGS